MALHSGARLGPYEVLALVGAGGMGEVYRARDPRLNREVAIKIVATDIAADPQALARFEREARAVARLSHPNILAIHDIGQQDGTTFAVMELLQGESLRRRLLGGALPTRKAVEIATQIARGLAAAHEAGIVHRDLKPENVFLTTDGQVKLLDFGLARAAPAAEDSRAITAVDIAEVTAPGTALGTPGYMAPEQVQGLRFDHRSDIFALGAVLYELLTGHRAFQGASSIDVMHAVLRQEPDVNALAEVPPAIRRIALRCLEKRPGDRFSSARDLGFALEAADEVGTGSGHGMRPTRPARGRAAVWALCGVALLAVGVAAGYLNARSRIEVLREPDRTAAPLRLRLQGPPGTPWSWTFSPDGRAIALLSYGESKPGPPDMGPYTASIWVRELARDEWREIAPATDAGLSSVAWAPDGRSVLYQVVSYGTPELRTVDVASGAVRSLAKAEAWGASWSRESGILIGGPTLRLISPGTGSIQDVFPVDGSIKSRRSPSFLPDGLSFVFSQNGSSASQSGIFLGRVGSPQTTRLAPAGSTPVVTPSGHLLYQSGTTLFSLRMDVQSAHTVGDPHPVAANLPSDETNYTWFAVSGEDALIVPNMALPRPPGQLTLFDRTGQKQEALGAPHDYRNINLSPDGRRIAALEGDGLGIVDIERRLFTPLSRPDPTGPGRTPSTADIWFSDPVWSPDGRTLAASIGVPADERWGDLVRVDVGTGELKTIVIGPGWWSEAWSRDGKQILVTRSNAQGSTIWTVPVDNPTAARRLTSDGPFQTDQAELSPQDRWLTYITNETGVFEVYIQGFGTAGERRRVSTRGGVQPRWRDDGRELFYLQPDGVLMAVPMSPSMELGAPVPLFTLRFRPKSTEDEYVVLPGGRRFIAIVPAERVQQSTLTVLTNWTSLLPR